jgi:hypothetical protein
VRGKMADIAFMIDRRTTAKVFPPINCPMFPTGWLDFLKLLQQLARVPGPLATMNQAFKDDN